MYIIVTLLVVNKQHAFIQVYINCMRVQALRTGQSTKAARPKRLLKRFPTCPGVSQLMCSMSARWPLDLIMERKHVRVL
jgi:hypothetical protein